MCKHLTFLPFLSTFRLANVIDYVGRSIRASINAGQDGDFANLTILEQFERLFQLLEFKEQYTDHTVEYMDTQGKGQMLNYYFQNGANNGMSKGLLEITKELKVKMPSKTKLDNLRALLSDHPAFKTVSFYTLLNLLNLLFCFTIYRFHD
jgi:hypothetical protein